MGRFTLTQAMLERLLHLQAVCTTEHLRDLADEWSLDAYEGENAPWPPDEDEPDLRIDCQALCVGAAYFQFEALLRNTNVEVRGPELEFATFFADVAAGRRYFSRRNTRVDDDALEDIATAVTG